MNQIAADQLGQRKILLRLQRARDTVTSFAILILNEKHGAIIREAKLPKQ
jgi:hypothetical protein